MHISICSFTETRRTYTNMSFSNTIANRNTEENFNPVKIKEEPLYQTEDLTLPSDNSNVVEFNVESIQESDIIQMQTENYSVSVEEVKLILKGVKRENEDNEAEKGENGDETQKEKDTRERVLSSGIRSNQDNEEERSRSIKEEEIDDDEIEQEIAKENKEGIDDLEKGPTEINLLNEDAEQEKLKDLKEEEHDNKQIEYAKLKDTKEQQKVGGIEFIDVNKPPNANEILQNPNSFYPNHTQERQYSRTEKKHSCTWCTKKFAYKYSLQRHMKFHKGKVNFLCELCGKSFGAVSGLYAHNRRNHNNENRKEERDKMKSVEREIREEMGVEEIRGKEMIFKDINIQGLSLILQKNKGRFLA